MGKIVKRIGKTEVVHKRGDSADSPVVSIWSRVQARFDSWFNLLTGIGVPGIDAGSATDFSPTVRLPDAFLESLYNGDDIAAKIIDAVVDDALRKGYEIVIEPEDAETGEANLSEAKEMGGDVKRFLEDELGATEKLSEAWAWGRLFGAGALYLVVDDGPDTDQAEELVPESVRKVEALTVLDKQDLDPASFYDDPSHPKFGEVETYRISTFGPSGNIAGQITNLQIHETRLILFEGVRTTNRRKQINEGFSLSVLQRVFEVLKQFNISWSALSNMLQTASQGVFKMEGLIEMIAGGESAVMQQRMQLVDLQRSVARSLLIDSETESFESVDTNVVGVPDALRVFMIRIAGAANMPLTRLLGMSPAGLNATGESDLLIWASIVEAEQNRVLRPRMMRLVELVMTSSEGPTGGQVPERWGIIFPELIQSTEKEQADVRKLTADADAIWIDRGVLLPEEVAINRFTADGFSTSTTIEVSDREAMLAPGPEPEPRPAPEPVPDPLIEKVTDPEAVDPTTALNGAQVKALQDLVLAVADGTLPKTTVQRMIVASFPISEVNAAAILKDVEEPSDDEPGGGGPPPTPPPPPFGGPPAPPPPGTSPGSGHEEEELDLAAERDDSRVWRADRVEKNGPEGKPFCVVSEAGERIACHATKAAANRQLAAIEAAKAARGDQAEHVHSIPGGGVTGPAGLGEHSHSLPGGGRTGSAQSGAGHTHSLPDGGQTGGPRAVTDDD
jgi:hypothetical protein